METLRLYPTVPKTQRIAVRETSLGGIVVPKGTQFNIIPWLLQRSPLLWGPKAGDFYPERWIDFPGPDDEKTQPKLNNHGGAQSNYALVTFLHGPRSCIGQGFAKAELRALLGSWVTSFDFALDNPEEEVKPFGTVTVKPKDGLKLRVRQIDTL
jgi:cytochrome P450